MRHSHVSLARFSANKMTFFAWIPQYLYICNVPHECCSGQRMSEVGLNAFRKGIWLPHYHCYPRGKTMRVRTNWQKADDETHNGGASKPSKELWLFPRVREHKNQKYGLLPMSRIFRWHECFTIHVSPSSHGARVSELRPLGIRLAPSVKLPLGGCSLRYWEQTS